MRDYKLHPVTVLEDTLPYLRGLRLQAALQNDEPVMLMTDQAISIIEEWLKTVVCT